MYNFNMFYYIQTYITIADPFMLLAIKNEKYTIKFKFSTDFLFPLAFSSE